MQVAFPFHVPLQPRCNTGTKTWKMWTQWIKLPPDMGLDRHYTTRMYGVDVSSGPFEISKLLFRYNFYDLDKYSCKGPNR